MNELSMQELIAKSFVDSHVNGAFADHIKSNLSAVWVGMVSGDFGDNHWIDGQSYAYIMITAEESATGKPFKFEFEITDRA